MTTSSALSSSREARKSCNIPYEIDINSKLNQEIRVKAMHTSNKVKNPHKGLIVVSGKKREVRIVLHLTKYIKNVNIIRNVPNDNTITPLNTKHLVRNT